MRPLLLIAPLILAACGAAGPPTPPPPKDAEVVVPAEPITTPTDTSTEEGDLSRPIDAATTTEEF